MEITLNCFSAGQRLEAFAELQQELAEFSHDGLVQLRDDLAAHGVLRGSWAGCVISYKGGSPGSCRRDRLGRARNSFTVMWDNGWLTDDEVRALVDRELADRARTGAARRPPSPALR